MKRVDLGEVPYAAAMADMQRWVEERRAGAHEDRLFLLTHPPVITYGWRTDPRDLPATLPGVPTVAVDRGGLATYHGPGQLVGYLVLDVRKRGPVDIVRWLERGLVEALDTIGFTTLRRDTPRGASSLVGVWTPEHRKLVSIGMRIRSGITSHGFAINVDPDMSVFRHFVACGLPDVEMTSLREISDQRDLRMPSDKETRDAIATALGAT
jgi:lipoate-protein ligase B